MTASDYFTVIITSIGGSAMLLAIAAWLMKKILTHFLDKDVEKFKSERTHEVERLKNDLKREALEHEVRFRRVDEKVAERLEEVYLALFAFTRAVNSYVSMVDFAGEPPKEEKLKLAAEASRKFAETVDRNRLYVPPKLWQQIDALGRKLVKTTNDFMIGLKREDDGRYSGDQSDHWSKAFATVRDDTNPAFKEIVDEFQKRLAVMD